MNTEQGKASDLESSNTFFDREVGWLRIDARRSRWITLAVLCALVLYLAVIATLSLGPINVFHNDALMLLDDGWRVLNGQVPHRDFFSPLGPLEFWIVAGGMLLAKGSAQGIAIGIAAFGFAIGLWGWLLSRRRLPALFSLLITAWLVLCAASPTPLGFDPRFLSCAMIYNRQGYALLGLILVECAFSVEKNRFWGGVSSGVAIVLLIFLKLNFFGVGGLMLLITVPLARVGLIRIWGFVTGAAGTFLAFLVYPRFSMTAFVSDMAFIIRARGSSFTPAGTIKGIATCAQSGIVWMVVAMTIALVVLIAPEQRWRRQNVNLVLLGLVVLASGPLFLQTNSLENSCQLASLWIIVLLERLSAIHLLQSNRNKIVTLALIAASLGGIAATVTPDLVSAINLLPYRSGEMKAQGARIAAAGMENMRFYDSTSFYKGTTKMGDGDGAYYVDCVNDGLAELTRDSKQQETILALGFHNPFSYLLRRQPADGGSSYLFMGNSITERHMPSEKQVFGDADLMMLPDNESTHRASDFSLQNYYRSYLSENYQFVARSKFWTLYRRNK